MKRNLQHNGLLFLISAAVIATDQLTKALVRQNLALGDFWAPIPAIGEFFRFAGPILTVVRIAIVIFIVVVYQKAEKKDRLMKVALSLMLGGAIGNLIDTFTMGFVTDFIAVGSFPIFNIADSCVTVGVGLMLLDMLLKEKSKPDSDQEETEENA